MATKKGIIITAIILVAIPAASFLVWVMPQNKGPTFVVQDYGNELEGVKQKHLLIMGEMNTNVGSLLNKTLTPDDFISRAKISSNQVTSLINELIGSNPPAKWRVSYLNYAEALRKYNDYLTETISFADKMKGGSPPTELMDEIKKMDSLKNDTKSFLIKSNETLP